MLFNTTLEDWPYVDPPTIPSYEFEKFDALAWRAWMARNWPISLLISAVYLIAIFGGRRIMKYREAFELRGLLIIWNVLLATFSLCGFLRTFPELYEVLTGPNGLHRSICVRLKFDEYSHLN
jgi:elongation of very long chain fatty acids protein 6